MKSCKYCGAEIENRRTFCSRQCAGAFRQNYKTCAVCDKEFKSPPSSPVVCCSRECSHMHRKNLHDTGTYDVSTGKSTENLSHFMETHSGEMHPIAKRWVIKSPDGQVYECINLRHFIREHSELFDGTIQQAWDGISKIKYSLQGKRKFKSTQWKGWTLLGW